MSGYNYKICELPSPELTTVSGYCDYEVNIGSITAYRGRAYGSPTVKIPLARIVEGYLGAEHLDITASGLTLESELDGWMEVELIQFYPDGTEEIVYYGALRSYDYAWNWDGESCTLSEPVNGRIDSRMQLLYSVYRKTTEEDIEIGIVPVVVIVPMQINVPAMDTTSYFTVQSNVPYVVTCSWDWLDVEQDSEDPNKWIISVDENTGNTRTASVEVRYQDERGHNVQQTVYVTQAEPIFEVEPMSLEFTPDAATQYITVNSNIKFNVQAGDEWLTVEPISGASGTTIIEVTAAQYSGLTDRVSTVTVGRATVAVTQKALTMIVEPSSLSFLPSGGAATVEVTSNGAYSVSSNRYWAVPSVSAGTSGTTTITISVEEYTGTSANRGATITIGNQTLSISQEKVSIVVTPSGMTLESPLPTGYTISVEANVPWSSYTQGNWVSYAPKSGGTGTTEINISVQENPSSARTGGPIFYNDTYSVYHRIFQPNLSIILSESAITASTQASTITVTVIANGNYSIYTDDTWISVYPYDGTSGTTTLAITLEENENNTRNGTVYVGNKQISIQQAGSSYSSKYLTFNVLSGGTINWYNTEEERYSGRTIYYSLDSGATWNTIDETDRGITSISVNAGDTVRVKGTNESYGYPLGGGHFSGGTAYFDIEGNIMSLIYGDNFIDQGLLSSSNNFQDMFRGTNVVSAENLILPATSLTPYCYDSMFLNCRSLISAPELPATTLASLCYTFMFTDCVSLAEAPELPATAMTDYCYFSMFNGCSSITAAPVLPAETLTGYCYTEMFANCTSLSYIDCKATTGMQYGVACAINWVYNVAPTGTFKRAIGSSWMTGADGIPRNWTVILDGVEITPSSAETTYSGGSITVTATSSGSYSVTTEADWVNLSSSTGASGTTVFTITPALNTGSARTASIYFGETEFTLSQEQYVVEVSISPSSGSVDATGGTVEVSATCLGPYTVTTAADWVTLSASAGTSGTSVFTITASENTGDTRTATVYFGDTVFTLSQAAPAPVYLNNYIYYTTTDGQPLTMNAATWTQNIVSHTYGVIEFDNDVTAIPNDAFSGQTTLATVTLPSSIETIGQHSFRYTSGLTMNFDTRNYPNLTSIGTTAFQGSNLSGCSVYLGSGLTLGTAIFGATKIYSAYTDSTTTGTTSELGPQLPQIRSVHFGPNVTHIRNICSNNSGNLVEIIFDGTTAPSYSTNAFSTSPGPGVMYYPSGSNYNGIISKLSSDWTITPV